MGAEVTTEPVRETVVDHRRVLAGFDGSRGSEQAVEWAAREARARGSSLRVVTCWAVPPQVDFSGAGARQNETLRCVVTKTQQRHPGLAICSAATNLDPRDALIDETERADLLVIGSSEAGAARQMLLGSVVRTAARRSACPVVVVNGSVSGPVNTMVVGTDGSAPSATALDWACAEASLHGADLRIVHAREPDVRRDEAQRLIDTAVDECRRRTTATVYGQVVEGPPAASLVRASQDADLVVIGSRGRSGFKTALFGSVALTVAEDAHCPVAVTHPRIRRD